MLPAPSAGPEDSPLRRHGRFSVKCPGRITYTSADGKQGRISIKVIEVSSDGFQALAHTGRCRSIAGAEATIQAGARRRLAGQRVHSARREARPWTLRFSSGRARHQLAEIQVSALHGSKIYSDLDNAGLLESRFKDTTERRRGLGRGAAGQPVM